MKPGPKPHLTVVHQWLPMAIRNGISERALRGRIADGWDPELAATKPMRRYPRAVPPVVADRRPPEPDFHLTNLWLRRRVA